MSENVPPLRVVVDTNLFVSASIRKSGPPHELLRAWRRRAFVVLMASQQRMELVDVLTRPKLRIDYAVSDDDLAELLNDLDSAARASIPSNKLPIDVRDEKDRHILAAAIGGNADYLVTGDNDLLTLAGDPRLGDLKIVTARAFLDLI